ncbi:MAG: hypothetical protein HY308_14980 [Gammaproteobacteria bacterium]|nr:hypothetical protein [Gammaproteobacteria bacterium]
MNPSIAQIYNPDVGASAYQAIPDAIYRVKLTFRVDFTNGGYVYGEDFLLDIPTSTVSFERAAEMVVSAMNLLRAGPVTIFSMQVVRRGEHQDAS